MKNIEKLKKIKQFYLFQKQKVFYKKIFMIEKQ